VQKVKSQRKSTLNSKNSASDIKQDELVGDKRVLETNKETTILPEHKPSSSEEVIRVIDMMFLMQVIRVYGYDQ